MTKTTNPADTKSSSFLESPLLLSASWLATLLGKSVRSVWRDNAADRLPRPVRVGGAVRWRREEILRWIDAGCPSRKKWETIEGKSGV
jgi:predicted DNA-binding transcriptional regulator AlpA